MTGPSALDVFLHETEPLRKKAARAAKDLFLESLPEEGIPGEKDWKAAARRAEGRALEEAAPGFAGAFASEDQGKAALFILRLQELLPSFSPGGPAVDRGTPPFRTALAAAFGALIGMGLLSPLTSLFFGSREAGFLLGGPLGAFALSLATLRLPENRRLLWALAALLGLASLREVFAFLGSVSLFSRGWNLLGKQRGSFSRMVLFPALLALVLLLGRRTGRLDRKALAESVEESLADWLEAAARIAFLTGRDERPLHSGAAPADAGLPGLAARILALEGAAGDDLAAGMNELAGEVRNLGYGNSGEPREFCWNSRSADHFEIFGSAEPGDRVRVERPPLFRDGRMLRRGLARKVRKP